MNIIKEFNNMAAALNQVPVSVEYCLLSQSYFVHVQDK